MRSETCDKKMKTVVARKKSPCDGVTARDDDDDTGKVTDPVADDDDSGKEDGERTDMSLALQVPAEERDKFFMPCT